MLKPLEQFICDTCGQVIDSPKNGFLEWITTHDPSQRMDFNIIHGKWASPLPGEGKCSQHETKLGRSDHHLDEFIGIKALEYFLPWIDDGPWISEDYKGPQIHYLREISELLRRLTLPYYEEARLYFDKAIEDGVIDDPGNPHTYTSPSYLKTVVDRYSRF